MELTRSRFNRGFTRAGFLLRGGEIRFACIATADAVLSGLSQKTELFRLLPVMLFHQASASRMTSLDEP